MASNRVIYAAALIAAIVFYTASGVWFSWLLLALIAALPLVSLLLSLPVMLSARVAAKLPPETEQGEKALLALRLVAKPLFPLPEIQMQLNLRSRDHSKDQRFLSRIARTDGTVVLDTSHCGFVQPEFRRTRIYDALGLFWLKVRTPTCGKMPILPAAVPPIPLPDLERLSQQQLKPKAGGGFSEVHDHRSYRPGDPVKGIHWKLSLKTGELVIREPLEPISKRVVIVLSTPRGAEQRDRFLGNLRFLCNWMLEREITHTVLWMDGQKLCMQEISDPEDAHAVLVSACCAEEDTAALPQIPTLRADWLYRIGLEGGAE